jgi:hypothetical protein
MSSSNKNQPTFVTAAINVSSDIGCSVVFENNRFILIASDVGGSRDAWSAILKVVLLTVNIAEEGRPSGRAEEKAHSSSSPAELVEAWLFAGG